MSDVLLRGFEAPSAGFDDKCKLTITKHLRVQKMPPMHPKTQCGHLFQPWW